MFRIRNLAPGIAYFGLTFVMLFTSIQVSKDRTTALLLRLYASPMKPVEYIFGYTMPMVVLAAVQMVICFGASELIHVILKLPSFAATLWLICKLTSEAVKFSITAFSGLEYYELRVKVSHYLLKGLKCVALSALPLVYDAIFVPKILNLWDSF